MYVSSRMAIGTLLPIFLCFGWNVWERGLHASDGPQRIISLLPSITELIFELGLGDRIVAVSDYCELPAGRESIPRIGGLTPNLEMIVSLAPDLILADVSQEEGLARAVELGYRVQLTPTTRLNSLDELFQLISRIGSRLGENARAESIVKMMRGGLRQVDDYVKGKPKPRALYVLWWEPLIVGGGLGLQNEILIRAGAVNVAHGLKNRNPRISDEFVIEKDPEVIIVSDEEGLKWARTRQGWSGITAIRQGRIHAVDRDMIARYGPKLIEGIDKLAHQIHETP